jgi:hypothetical protein
MPLHYRLKIQDAGGADLVVIATLPSETHPYILETPSGDGESFDPLTGAVQTGGYSITVIDAPHGSGSRVLTRFLTDSNKRWQLLGHKALLQVADAEPVSWATLLTGFVTHIKQLDALAFEIEVGETRWVETRHEIWRTVSTQFDRPSCIIGGPIRGGFAGFPDLGPWRFTATTVQPGATGTGYVRLSLVYAIQASGSFAAWLARLGTEKLVKRANRHARDYMVKDSRWLASLSTRAWYPRLLARIENPATGALVGHFNPIDRSWLTDFGNLVLGIPGGLLGMTGTPQLILDWTGTGGQPAQPFVNTEFNVYVFPVDISEKNPLHIEGHPLDIHTLAYDEAGIPWDATSKASVRGQIGDDEWIALRPTQARTVESLTRLLQGVYGYATKIGPNGERVFFMTRLRSSSLPSTTITINDLRGEGTPLTLDSSRALASFGIRHFEFFPYDENIDPGEPPIDGIIAVPHERIGDVASPVALAGQDVRFEMPGAMMVRTANAAAPIDLEARVRGIGRELDDRYGRGPWEMTLPLRRGVNVSLGEEVTVSLPYQVDANAVPADRGGSRIMQVVHRTPVDEGIDIDLIDSGTSAQVPTAPAFTLAADVQDPKRTVIATLTNAPALVADGSLVRIEVSLSGGARLPFTYIDPAVLTSVRLGPFDSGSHVAVGMRAERPQRRPSGYQAASFDLPDLSPPTGLTRVGTLLSWTIAEATAALEVRYRMGGEATWTRLALLPPGTREVDVAQLRGGIFGTVSVRHRDFIPFNGVSADVTVDFTTPAEATPQAPTAPSAWVGTPDERGVRVLDGTYGYDVTAVTVPGDVEFEVAIETAVGSGTPGTYESVLMVPATTARARYVGYAPRDGKRRWIRAWGVLNGVRSSAASAALMVDPWGAIVRPRVGPRDIINFADALGNDDGWAMRASNPNGRESNLSLFITNTETLKVGTVGAPSTITKTVRVPYTAMLVMDPNDSVYYANGYMYPGTTPAHHAVEGHFVFPRGVTLTALRLRGYRQTGGEHLVFRFDRISDTGVPTNLINNTLTGSGWITASFVLNETVAAEDYLFWLEFGVTGGGPATDVRLAYIEVDYQMPSYDKGI